MANTHRGEIEAILGGRRRTLVLTLGALAELENAFDATDMLAVAERFSTGRISAHDAILVIAAGLRGAGEVISNEEVAALIVENGAGGYIETVAHLLEATFAERNT